MQGHAQMIAQAMARVMDSHVLAFPDGRSFPTAREEDVPQIELGSRNRLNSMHIM